MPVSAKTGRFPLKIGSKREEKEGKSWKIVQFSDVWPAKFSNKFDGDVLYSCRHSGLARTIPRIRFDTNLVRNMILLESTAVLNLVRRPVRKFRVRRGHEEQLWCVGANFGSSMLGY